MLLLCVVVCYVCACMLVRCWFCVCSRVASVSRLCCFELRVYLYVDALLSLCLICVAFVLPLRCLCVNVPFALC